MKVQDTRFFTQQAGHVHFRRQTRQLVEGRLAGPMVADGQFAQANHTIDVHDIAAYRAGQRRWRDMVTAGPAPGRQPFFPQSPGTGNEACRGSCFIIRSKQTDDRGYAGRREMGKWDRRGLGGKTVFTTAAGDMDMAVNQARGLPLRLPCPQFPPARMSQRPDSHGRHGVFSRLPSNR